MKLSDLDKAPGYGFGGGPLSAALTWLETCLASPASTWNEEQRAEARRVLHDARKLLGSPVIEPDCATCAHADKRATEEPCTSCRPQGRLHLSHWEPQP